MGLVSKISISKLAQHKFIRFDLKYWIIQDNINLNNFILLKDLFEIINGNSYTQYYVEYKTDKAFIRIGNLTFKGKINNTNLIYLDENFQIPKDKKLKYNDLILATIGATIGKINLAREYDNGAFSNNTVVLRAKKIINPIFYEKLFQTNLMQKYIFGIASQKAQPNLQTYDIEEIKIPNIDLILQNKAIKQIEPIEKEIQILKLQKKEHLEIINDIFNDEFQLNIDEINKLDNQKQFDLKLTNVTLKNDSLRTSFKWHKLEKIQSYMYKDINCIEKLSKYIIATKNGWSPESSEIEDGIPVLGQEHILKNGKISLSASKFTTLTKSNIQDFYVKKDDFFVSRGNTVELVAMAGLVTDEVEENILYPDLYIKIEFDKIINKQYIAYLFNSFIGRLYFKHVAKGKNQTMVKVSSKELYDFYLPIPSKVIQQKLVTKIKTKIDNQKDIDKQIKQKQDEISRIIEDSINA